MHAKKAFLIINPRTGQNVTKLADVLAVLAAAGWETNIAIKEYGGHTMELASKAAKDGYDLIIAYGGDGTLNQVVNGVMSMNGQKSKQRVVGVIPGGTMNIWAGEIGVPVDPVKAALALVNSEARRVDIGYVAIHDIALPEASHAQTIDQLDGETKQQNRKKSTKGSAKARHHFLLMAGLGIDAAIMGNVSKPLKYKIGPLAVGLSAAKGCFSHHPFPIEIRAADNGQLWKGEALQVVIGNTRRYGDIAEMTPNAYIDDGMLDVCVITAGDPLTTVEQIVSLLLRRKPDNLTAEYFHEKHLYISVPSSVPMQLDGSAVKLKDYLSKSEYDTLDDTEHTMITYCFDAMPSALEMAIPCSYDDTLFEHSTDPIHTNTIPIKSRVKVHKKNENGTTQTASQLRTEEEVSNATSQVEQKEDTTQHNGRNEIEKESPELVQTLLEYGHKVTVVGKTPNPEKKHTYIIAGSTPKQSTGEEQPVAVIINESTTLLDHQGTHIGYDAVQRLQEGAIIVVEGKKSKRGVMKASRAVM